MSADTPAASSIETTEGFTISSDEGFTAEEKASLTAKPIPPEKLAKNAENGGVKVEAVDEKGREHGADGKFKSKDGAEPKEAKSEPEAKPEEKPAKDRARERIEQLARANAEKDRELAEERNARRELEKRLIPTLSKEPERKPAPDSPPAPRQDAAADGSDAEPDEETFDGTYSEWVKAHGKWASRQAVREATKAIEARQRSEQRDSSYSRLSGTLQKAFDAAGGDEFIATLSDSVRGEMVPHFALPDFDGEGSPSTKPLNALGTLIAYKEADAPKFYKYLSENPAVLDRFRSVANPLQLEREFGRLEALIERDATAGNPPRKDTPFVPRANPPVRPVTGSPHIAEPDLSNVEDFDEFMAKSGATRRR